MFIRFCSALCCVVLVFGSVAPTLSAASRSGVADRSLPADISVSEYFIIPTYNVSDFSTRPDNIMVNPTTDAVPLSYLPAGFYILDLWTVYEFYRDAFPGPYVLDLSGFCHFVLNDSLTYMAYSDVTRLSLREYSYQISDFPGAVSTFYPLSIWGFNVDFDYTSYYRLNYTTVTNLDPDIPPYRTPVILPLYALLFYVPTDLTVTVNSQNSFFLSFLRIVLPQYSMDLVWNMTNAVNCAGSKQAYTELGFSQSQFGELSAFYRAFDTVYDLAYERGYNAGLEAAKDPGSDAYQLGYSVGYDTGFNLGHTFGYDAGKVYGYNNGYSVGYDQGVLDASNSNDWYDAYNLGREAGYADGYNVGLADGAERTSTFTFFGLLSAVIDAPIQAFNSLFNWDLFGINLKTFLFALMTVAFCLRIISLIMGKI